MNCLICQDVSLRPKFKLPSYALAECRRCGVLFNVTYYENPGFRKDLFESRYYESVQSEAFKHKLDDYARDPSLPFFGRYLDWIQKRVKPGKLLDVGCAFGNFLVYARSRGWDPHGVELSEYASEKARQRWGIPVFTGDVTRGPYEPGSFDVVTFWDAIEHVARPKEAILKTFELLKPGGFLLLSTDNRHGLIASMARFFYEISFGQWTYPIQKFYIPYNTCFFDPGSLTRLLADCGFKNEYACGVDYPIEKMNLSAAERWVVTGLYFAGRLAQRPSQFLLIAKKT